MNTNDYDVLKSLKQHGFTDQRSLAQLSGVSLGAVNSSLKTLRQNGLINELSELTPKARELFRDHSTKNAVILAAGFGTRMIPINSQIPKALLEVNGEPLIERQIKLLHSAGIREIYVAVGYMKEKLEYLIDEYNVELIVNREHVEKNNLHTLNLAAKHISDTYIVPCDIYCLEQPFSAEELYSWYAVSEECTKSGIRINRKKELVRTGRNETGNAAIGIAYISHEDAAALTERLRVLDESDMGNDLFWEEALFEKNKMSIFAKKFSPLQLAEINTYEQLRELDESSKTLRSCEIERIARVMNTKVSDISGIIGLKKGMTNRSFVFTCKGKRYIMRIPGKGTNMLINRKNEAKVYNLISGRGICDDVIYIDPETGYKITEYIENARVCDPENENDLVMCMEKLRSFHEMKLQADHSFDLFGQILFYEKLCGEMTSVYKDYEVTKKNVFSLAGYIEHNCCEKVLTHIDAVPDNFLIYKDRTGQERVQLTDWEYSGMQDPCVDLAMFSIYSFYSREQTDRLIDIYFRGSCPWETRIKIYCYMSVCGLLWSNWCEYKRTFGVDFGEYSLRQYRYAKEYYKLVKELMENE